MKIAFVQTNGYDAMILADGSWFKVEAEDLTSLLAVTSSKDVGNWHGTESYSAETVAEEVEKWVEEGAELVAYYGDGGLVIVDENRFQERKEFYGV